MHFKVCNFIKVCGWGNMWCGATKWMWNVLGNPYLHDRKEIFYKEHNRYHLNKEGNGYVVHAHHLKENQSL